MSAKQRKLLWPAVIAAAVIFTVLLLVSARTKATAPLTVVAPGAVAPASAAVVQQQDTVPAAQIDSAKDRVEGEIVAVTPNGFEPKQITRPAGQFLLFVDNRTGLDGIQVRVERVTGRERLHDVGLSKRDYTWNNLMRLPPGDYVITEASHPDWVCRLTITPN